MARSTNKLFILVMLMTITACQGLGKLMRDKPAYDKIILMAPDSVVQRENFWVRIEIIDHTGHIIEDDWGQYIQVKANQDILLPPGDIMVQKSAGGFWARSDKWAGEELIIFTGKWASNEITVLPSPYRSASKKRSGDRTEKCRDRQTTNTTAN